MTERRAVGFGARPARDAVHACLDARLARHVARGGQPEDFRPPSIRALAAAVGCNPKTAARWRREWMAAAL